jgi:hypothetical protein
MTGFGVLITFIFFIYIVSRDWSQLVGLQPCSGGFNKPSWNPQLQIAKRWHHC